MMDHNRPLYVLAVGATVDKIYSRHGSVPIGAPAAELLLSQVRTAVSADRRNVGGEDPMSMTMEGRKAIAHAVREASDGDVVIVHGADTFVETARVLAEDPSRDRRQTVVLTGVSGPTSRRDSEALFNLGAALTAAQLMPPGVFVSMAGRTFPAQDVVEDTTTGELRSRSEAETAASPSLLDRAGREYALDDPRWQGEDGSPLSVSVLPGMTKAQILGNERSLWRYSAALPVDASQRISLGEGFTPLVSKKWSGHQIHFKLEWFNPTSSFKDRGVSVMMSHLRSHGVTSVLEDSSGNGGSAVAAYAAAAEIPAKIIVPAATSEAKILQARAFGAEIEKVPGTRDEVGREAIRQSAEISYASHNWHPMFLQGTKTIAYEMWEMLGFREPDNVVLVAGAGSLILGCDIAFRELLTAGEISRMPRLLVGQPEHWATIVDTFNGVAPDSRGEREPTSAEGASIAKPIRLREAVDALRRSGGHGYAVPEEEIQAATERLVRMGLYAEPTSAVAAAALEHFIATGAITPAETTVVVLTGSGLKSSERMAALIDSRQEYSSA